MTGDQQKQLKAGVMKWLIEVLHLSSKTIGAGTVVIAFIATVGMWFYDNLISESLAAEVQQLAGTPTVLKAVEKVDEQVAVQGVQIERLGMQVEAITPPPVVVEYDPIRSRSMGPCVRGELCEIQMRLRRTAFGITCGTPTVLSRTFIDFDGLITTPRPGPANAASRASKEWTLREMQFEVPHEAETGIGEYFMLLEYPDCEAEAPDGRRVTIPRTMEETFHVRVMVTEEEPDQ